MTRSLSILASPNQDLAVDRKWRVYKLKASAWVSLNYWFSPGDLMLDGRSRSSTFEVSA